MSPVQRIDEFWHPVDDEAGPLALRLFLDDREIARVVDYAPLDDLPLEQLAQPPRGFCIEWCLADETAPRDVYRPDPRSFVSLEAAIAAAFADHDEEIQDHSRSMVE